MQAARAGNEMKSALTQELEGRVRAIELDRTRGTAFSLHFAYPVRSS